MSINTYTYPNGLRIIYEKTENIAPITSIYAFCDLGSVYEMDEYRGVSHFIEHMCFKGTKKLPVSTDISVKYDKIGAQLNAFTDKRYTCYTVKCENEYVENCIEILSDMLTNSIFNKTEYKKEEKVVIEENSRDIDDPKDILFEEMDKLIYNGSSYENPIDTISYHKSHFEYKKVMEVYHSFYVPDRMVLSIVSNLSYSTIKKYINTTYFATKHRGKGIPVKFHIQPNIYKQTETKYTLTKKVGIKTVHLAIGFKIDRKDKYPLELLKNLLSGPMSSRLFTILREENGVTYTSSISSEYYDEVGDFTIYAEMNYTKLLKNDKKPGVLPLIIDLINELIRYGVHTEEVQNTKGYMRGDIDIELEDTDNIAEYNGSEYLMYPNEKVVPYNKIYETYLKDIKKDEVDKVIRKYFVKENMCVCLVGDELPSINVIKQQCERIYKVK